MQRYRNLTDAEWQSLLAHYPYEQIDDAYLDVKSGLVTLSNHHTERTWKAEAPASFLEEGSK